MKKITDDWKTNLVLLLLSTTLATGTVKLTSDSSSDSAGISKDEVRQIARQEAELAVQPIKTDMNEIKIMITELKGLVQDGRVEQERRMTRIETKLETQADKK